MMNKILDILKAKFLVNENAKGNWAFIVYISVLALIMISASHRADNKVFEIDQLDSKVKKLRGEFVDNRSKLQAIKLKSVMLETLKKDGYSLDRRRIKRIKVTLDR